MLQPSDKTDFALEPLGPGGRGQFGSDHLERDGAIVLEVAGEVHRGHAAATELALDQVSTGQGGLEGSGDTRHE
jgi:hypothetical protein